MAHFAPQAEQEWFAKQLDEEQAFYRCWCLREAVLKSQGVGIVKLSSVVHLPRAVTDLFRLLSERGIDLYR